MVNDSYNINIDSLEVRDVININLLQDFQDNFAKSMNIASVTVDRNGNPVTKPSSYTTFCTKFIHSNPIGDKRCAEFHRRCGEISAKMGRPYIYSCHAGLVDFAAPILINGEHIGTILGGQVLTEKYDEGTCERIVKELNVDKDEVMDSLKKINMVTVEYVTAAAELLYTFANELSKKGYEALELKVNSRSLRKDVSRSNLLLKESKMANEMMAKRFSTLSHELRTPLNIIFSTVQLLESYHKNNSCANWAKTFSQYSNIMKQNCYRLTKLISNIVDINKIDLGVLNIYLENNDIINIVESITLSVIGYARSKNINIIFDTDVEEKIILCDADKIERIMLNLLSNAIKFTQVNGEINVNVYDGEDYITISVKDNGMGIPKEMFDKIFNTFTQGDESLTRNTEGCGIGLSIVKSLVKMHGGSVTVKSEVGIGSEFIVKLPVEVELNKDNASRHNMLENHDENVKIEFSDFDL